MCPVAEWHIPACLWIAVLDGVSLRGVPHSAELFPAPSAAPGHSVPVQCCQHFPALPLSALDFHCCCSVCLRRQSCLWTVVIWKVYTSWPAFCCNLALSSVATSCGTWRCDLLAQTCPELCQYHPGCAMGSFSETCRPRTPFWKYSSVHEVFLQPFITFLMDFPSALQLLAEDPTSLNLICSVSQLRKPLFRSSSLQIPFWMLLFSTGLWQPWSWCHWGGSSSEVMATLHFLTLVLLLAPQGSQGTR